MIKINDNIINTNTITVDPLNCQPFSRQGVEADVLRLDRIHPVISGNKWFKLKYYLESALLSGKKEVITSGGPYSNHILATACATSFAGLQSTGIIKGDKPLQMSPTIRQAMDYGMHMEFTPRKFYHEKINTIQNECLTGQTLLFIPEGGAGEAGVRGCEEILNYTSKQNYTHILCAVGTGTMFCGIANSCIRNRLIGISIIKNAAGQLNDIKRFFSPSLRSENLELNGDYHFGGYAKKNPKLLQFMKQLFTDTGIPSDFVYTAKLFYAAFDLTAKNHFAEGSKLLLIHSGGLQGNRSLPEATLNF